MRATRVELTLPIPSVLPCTIAGLCAMHACLDRTHCAFCVHRRVVKEELNSCMCCSEPHSNYTPIIPLVGDRVNPLGLRRPSGSKVYQAPKQALFNVRSATQWQRSITPARIYHVSCPLLNSPRSITRARRCAGVYARVSGRDVAIGAYKLYTRYAKIMHTRNKFAHAVHICKLCTRVRSSNRHNVNTDIGSHGRCKSLIHKVRISTLLREKT